MVLPITCTTIGSAQPGRYPDHMSRSDLNAEIDRLDGEIRASPNDAELYLKRAHTWTRLGNYQRAIDDLTEVIHLRPQDAFAYRRRGFLRQIVGDPQEAVRDYDEALPLDPTDHSSWNNRGNAKSELGDKSGAISDLSQAIRLGNDFDSRINRAIVFFEIGNLQAALDDLDAVEREVAGSDSCHLWRGLTRLRLGYVDGALEDLAEARRIASWRLERGRYDPHIHALILYGHALAKRAKGDDISADADALAARSMNAGVEAKFAKWGLV